MAAIALTIGFAAIYTRLTATDLMIGDGGELTMAAATNGVAHPPGYPLWIMLAHAFTARPGATIPFHAGLLSVVCHALTIGVVCLAGSLLTRRVLAGAYAGALLGVTPLFVTWSIQPEVFALNDFFAALLLLCTLIFMEREGAWWLLVVIFGLFGLALSNQQTILFFAPILAWALWCKRGDFPRGARLYAVAGGSVAAALLGIFLPYVHTLVASQRDLDFPFQTAKTIGELFSLLARQSYGTGALVSTAEFQGGSPFARIGATIVAIYPVLVAAILGAMLYARKAPRTWVPPAIVAVLIFAFCLIANLNVENALTTSIFTRFALLPLTLLAPYAAFVVRARVLSATAAIVVLAIGIPLAQHYSLRDRHDARTLVRDAFATLPKNATLLIWQDQYTTTIPYFHFVEGFRPDVTVVAMDLLRPLSADYEATIRRTGITIGTAEQKNSADERDALVAANPTRTFYELGGNADIADTAFYKGYRMGLPSYVLPPKNNLNILTFYENGAAAMSAPDFGHVSLDPNTTNGWGRGLAGIYADAYYNIGMYARDLHRMTDAQKWFRRALDYLPGEPLIQQALKSVR